MTGVQRREPALDFLTANDGGIEDRGDPDVLESAARQGRILVSHDTSSMPVHFLRSIAIGTEQPWRFPCATTCFCSAGGRIDPVGLVRFRAGRLGRVYPLFAFTCPTRFTPLTGDLRLTMLICLCLKQSGTVYPIKAILLDLDSGNSITRVQTRAHEWGVEALTWPASTQRESRRLPELSASMPIHWFEKILRDIVKMHRGRPSRFRGLVVSSQLRCHQPVHNLRQERVVRRRHTGNTGRLWPIDNY